MINDLFNTLIRAKINPNQLYLLHCLRNGCSTININPYLEIRNMPEGYLDANNQPTDLAIELLDELDAQFKTKSVKASKTNMGANYMDYITKYLNLFPKKKLPSGKLARSTPKNIETNFKWFFDNYDYDWETILKATAQYVDEYERNGYKYMQTSKYFICKSNIDKSKTSELADYCELIASGGELDEDTYFKEKVV